MEKDLLEQIIPTELPTIGVIMCGKCHKEHLSLFFDDVLRIYHLACRNCSLFEDHYTDIFNYVIGKYPNKDCEIHLDQITCPKCGNDTIKMFVAKEFVDVYIATCVKCSTILRHLKVVNLDDHELYEEE